MSMQWTEKQLKQHSLSSTSLSVPSQTTLTLPSSTQVLSIFAAETERKGFHQCVSEPGAADAIQDSIDAVVDVSKDDYYRIKYWVYLYID